MQVKKCSTLRWLAIAIVPGIFMLLSFEKKTGSKQPGYTFPFQQAGLTERAAAAHLLNRFTYGAKPGQVDAVIKLGLENWFALQLASNDPDDSLKKILTRLDAVDLTNQQIVNTYPNPAALLKMAIDDGVITREEAAKLQAGDKKKYREQLASYMIKKGLKPGAELFRQLINQKVLRAAYTNNQLQEVITAFWFNHFNVSLTKNEAGRFVMAYERDAIRPNALGRFETLLLATAKSPAMLTFLDNAKSMVDKSNSSQVQMRQQQRMLQAIERQQSVDPSMQQMDLVNKIKQAKKEQGLNENYAREIMELHTMGVDGGYTQADVTQAARILTGWTVYPMEGYGRQAAQKITSRFTESQLASQGFVHDGDFLFAANRHDFGEKMFMGKKFESGSGYEEGLQLIHLLATSQATANFICKKLAVRFVSDEPPASLVKKLADTFIKQEGDIKAVLITMVTAPEFWSSESTREKIKSPFELAISTVRALDAAVYRPYEIHRWTTKMGEELYHYQAPTGFPDKGRYWISTGSLLYRMNFGLAFANGQIPGIKYDLNALTNNHEPESATAALRIYGAILMPERNLDETLKRLLPLINDPGIQEKISAAASKTKVAATEDYEDEMSANSTANRGQNYDKAVPGLAAMPKALSPSAVSQVIGILIGSPEFQRR